MKRYILSVIMIAVGLLTIIAHKLIAITTIEDQNRLWNFGFGRTETKITEFLAILFGFILITC